MLSSDRFNKSLEIHYSNNGKIHIHKIGAGYTDRIHVYLRGNELVVLSVNEYLGYVSIEVFNGDGRVGEMFMQDYQMTEAFGTFDIDPDKMANLLYEHLSI